MHRCGGGADGSREPPSPAWGEAWVLADAACALAAAEAVPAHRYRAFSAGSPDCGERGLLPHVDVDTEEIDDERGQILPAEVR